MSESSKKAFNYLEAGNNLHYKNVSERKQLSYFVENIKKSFNSGLYKTRIKLKPFYKTPYFIVGMPRSGSFLIEQILTSHSEIYGLGESRAIPEFLKGIGRHIETDVAEFCSIFKKLSEDQLYEKVKQYEAEIKDEVKNEQIYTDKMLKKFKYIGFIKILLPNAKFIHIKRHPLDNCLSCYERKFTQGHEYTYDLSVLGEYYSAYLDLMKYWKSIFPDDIYEVSYEELVLDTETVVRDCLGFMHLELESACLESYKNKRVVFTASTDQVREKIHDRAIGKWKKYESQLQPLIQELKNNVVALD